MKKSNFSEMCMAVSALCLIVGIIGGIIAWVMNESFLMFIVFLIPASLLSVIFGAISEHLQRMSWIVWKMGYEEENEIK